MIGNPAMLGLAFCTMNAATYRQFRAIMLIVMCVLEALVSPNSDVRATFSFTDYTRGVYTLAHHVAKRHCFFHIQLTAQ